MALGTLSLTPYAPGEAPFHVKGHVYRSFREYADEHVPGGSRAALDAVKTPALRAFLGQEFLAASWYDVFPFVAMAEPAAVLMGLPYATMIRRASRVQAERDMKGIYRAILHLASPEMLVERLPRAASRYFDFARTEVKLVQPGLWESRVTGIPQALIATYSAMTDEFLKVVFEATGARAFRTQTFFHEPDGESRGVPLVRYVRRLQWER